jgi:hypothetical protein
MLRKKSRAGQVDLLGSDAINFGRCVHELAEAMTDSESG